MPCSENSFCTSKDLRASVQLPVSYAACLMNNVLQTRCMCYAVLHTDNVVSHCCKLAAHGAAALTVPCAARRADGRGEGKPVLVSPPHLTSSLIKRHSACVLHVDVSVCINDCVLTCLTLSALH